MRRDRFGALALLSVALLGVAGCEGDPTAPGEEGGEGFSFSYDGGARHSAAGNPKIQGGDVSPGTFAIAFPDSVGGLVIASFEQSGGTRGDLFILQLTELRPGDFGPCASAGGGSCHGRLLEDIDAAQLHDLGEAWEIVSGGVHLDESGPARVRGSFSELVLEARLSDQASRLIPSGSFDLPLLSEAEGIDVMQCFLKRATGATAC